MYCIQTEKRNVSNMRKNIGSVLALYPTPVCVAGTKVDGKTNWLLVAHVGILGHDRLLISCAKAHYTNKGIKESRVVSVNLIDEQLLSKADYVGSVSGKTVDKSNVFDEEIGETGVPMIKDSPLTMECIVENNYETEDFDNFILLIKNTFVKEECLDKQGKINYDKLKPVLFEMPTYQYLSTGEVLGKCLKLEK